MEGPANASEDVGKLGQPLWRPMGRFLKQIKKQTKKLKIQLPYVRAVPLPGMDSEGSISFTEIRTAVFSSGLSTTARK